MRITQTIWEQVSLSVKNGWNWLRQKINIEKRLERFLKITRAEQPKRGNAHKQRCWDEPIMLYRQKKMK